MKTFNLSRRGSLTRSALLSYNHFTSRIKAKASSALYAARLVMSCCLLLFSVGNTMYAQTIDLSTFSPSQCIDSGVLTSSGTVSNADFMSALGVVPVAGSTYVLGTDVEVSAVSFELSHTWASDLGSDGIELVAPDASRITLFTDDAFGSSFGTGNIDIGTSASNCGLGGLVPFSFADGVSSNGIGFTGYTANPHIAALSFTVSGLDVFASGTSAEGSWSVEFEDDAGGDNLVVDNVQVTFSQIVPSCPQATVVCPSSESVSTASYVVQGVALVDPCHEIESVTHNGNATTVGATVTLTEGINSIIYTVQQIGNVSNTANCTQTVTLDLPDYFKIGTTTYSSLQAAIAALPGGGDIFLIDDYTESIVTQIPIGIRLINHEHALTFSTDVTINGELSNKGTIIGNVTIAGGSGVYCGGGTLTGNLTNNGTINSNCDLPPVPFGPTGTSPTELD